MSSFLVFITTKSFYANITVLGQSLHLVEGQHEHHMMLANDRRRLNAPAGSTSAPIFTQVNAPSQKRLRQPGEHRKIFLKTGVVPSAAGSAYYELQPDAAANTTPLLSQVSSTLKLSVTVHGPRPLPRNAAFAPNLLLTTHVKFAPFATHVRRGYVRDSSERDLGVHLENALRGVIIGERWPKSAVDVVVTILEGEDGSSASNDGAGQGWGMMNVLAGAITASSAALVEAGIDCVDLVSGGVAGLYNTSSGSSICIDPVASEQTLDAQCVVSYLQSRDEITETWLRGDAGSQVVQLLEEAIACAKLERTVLVEAVREMAEAQLAAKTAAEKSQVV